MSPDDLVLRTHGRPPAAAPMALCRTCLTLTPKGELMHHGAQCRGCYGDYCRTPQRHPDIGDKRVSAKAWARALEVREKARDSLTLAQREMWRAASRAHSLPVEDADA